MTLQRIAALLIATALAGCSSPEADWQAARTEDNPMAYQAFLEKHPDSEFADDARARLAALAEAQAWQQVEQADTPEAYQRYLDAHPAGAHAAAARERLVAIEGAADWERARADGSAEALQGFVDKYPQSTEAEQARAMLGELEAQRAAAQKAAEAAAAERAGDYRVQLAAFRNPADAQRLRDRLLEQHRELLRDVVVVPPQPPAEVHRVRSAPMSLEAARAACAALKKAGQDCLVVSR